MKKRISLPNGSNSDQRRRYIVNPYGSEHAAKAERGAVHLVFGRHARALDQVDFQDREPWEIPPRAPGAWVR